MLSKKLIDTAGDEAVLSAEVRSNKLLVLLLRKGYIDEKYVNYVNYFKGSSITTSDMNYILGVKNHEAKPFDYSISKVAQVVHRLLPHEFEQRETLNFTVLEYLLTSAECEDKLSAMIKQLSDGSELSWRFIDPRAAVSAMKRKLLLRSVRVLFLRRWLWRIIQPTAV